MHLSDTLDGHASGVGYDPTLEAAEHGIRIAVDVDAPHAGSFDATESTIKVRYAERTYYRTTATYQLARATLDDPTPAEAVRFAGERLIDDEDLAAVASVTHDRRLWARVLRVNEWLLLSHLALLQGLPLAIA